jgi:hypothetical protein
MIAKAQGLALRVWPLAGLDQYQEPGRAGSQARGGGRLAPMNDGRLTDRCDVVCPDLPKVL